MFRRLFRSARRLARQAGPLGRDVGPVVGRRLLGWLSQDRAPRTHGTGEARAR